MIAKESQEQIAIIKWAQYYPIVRDHLFAIPNGGSRHRLEAYNLKRQGVKSGVSDIFLAYPVQPYAGLWIELKRIKKSLSRLTRDQKEWLERMQLVGYDTYVAYGAEQAIYKIRQYLGAALIGASN